ncbi:Astacin (Peptidase family M12A) [Rhizobiales bacterium GAS191]|nr:Astacin (Peptidase family M12A) [Rhizobiales bacterium GAS191]
MPACAICRPKYLPGELIEGSIDIALAINPTNGPSLQALKPITSDAILVHPYIAVVTRKYWRTNGVRLTVQFLDNPPNDLRARILSHMNAWSSRLNAQFTETAGTGQVRLARTPGDGYWSYLGTDILSIPADQPTMNLDSFSMQTPEAEYHRVVRHETGHTLGCPHEHMRRELVAKIDPQKAIDYFQATQGWTPDQTRAQVLTPIEESSLWGTAHTDPNSIMCYQIPGTITVDGNPITGGTDIDDTDFAFMEQVYPKVVMSAPATTGPAATGPAATALSAPARALAEPTSFESDAMISALIEKNRSLAHKVFQAHKPGT